MLNLKSIICASDRRQLTGAKRHRRVDIGLTLHRLVPYVFDRHTPESLELQREQRRVTAGCSCLVVSYEWRGAMLKQQVFDQALIADIDPPIVGGILADGALPAAFGGGG